ncbi:ribose/xylose/arabinose/galactoside ABC-type transport system permease subunit [Microbacteriaceae bacterium SG_E_30_P1]|uniref:Ribose/xylose/arabinose/galactoside ABC-type transport system permease subunit n=1 Tax=Antiquaquibacter oligotrophicus TaxID=2880260 RepID=A0ABT6KMG1_9MICO|nr:sugar ABC transporter permease YjfF [Antiquaquibacter oligotrophicus]MDH6181201.1 ribose/xylose/arabinose/galactoside ABC-type transport system permease subunit [Antiquaquibacter oligotrophicus]UDF13104.1 sugar ABC transporter permease YjfF [Antiquaquibacter oligotrophicus]
MSIQTPVQSKPTAVAVAQRFLSRHVSWIPVFAAIVILVAMFLGAQAYFGNFLTPRVISSLLLDNAYLLILAVGMTFVILTGGIDLSVGAVMAFTGMLGASLLRDGLPVGIVIPVMLLLGAGMGLAVGILIQYFDVQPFIASLAAMFAARGLAFMVSLSSIRVEEPAILWLQSTRIQAEPGSWFITPTGIIALLVVLVGALLLAYTRFGRTIYAIGGNEQSARLMGLPVVRTKLLAYVISGVCAGLAGVVFTAYTGASYPLNGIGTELDTIAAVVIGGTLLTGGSGYVLGSMIGVLVYGTIKTGISFLGADQSWTRITIGALLLLFVVVQRVIVSRSSRR